MKQPYPQIMDHLNLLLETRQTHLRYVRKGECSGLITYRLEMIDPYIDPENYISPNVTKAFEQEVRDFFKKYDITDLGYTNTVNLIYAVEK